MQRILLIKIFLLTGSLTVFSQADSTHASVPDKFHSLRLGAGFEKSLFVEVGYSYLDMSMDMGSICFYASGQLNKTLRASNMDYLYGAKIGVESTWTIWMGGLELKYLGNGSKSQVFFTPRIGLSALGAISLTYGRNFPTSHRLTNEVGTHQISLTANLASLW